MAHDLVINDSKKVLTKIDECIGHLKKLKGVIETTAAIGDMDLAIGGISAAFTKLIELVPSVEDSIKVFESAESEIEEHVARFERMNNDITY